MVHTAERVALELVPNALSRALEARGDAPLVDLTCTNPTELGLGLDPVRLSAVLAAIDPGRYTPDPFGEPRARAALAHWLSQQGPPVDAADIMLTASTSEAYAYLFKLLADPGDEVLVPSPSYPLFELLARLEGVRIVPYPLAFDGEWHVDLTALRGLRGPRTRALVAVHPNNPTGSFVQRDELDALGALGLPIISDEVFAAYRYAASDSCPRTLAELGERALVFRLGGLSKSLLLPHWKLAWTALSGPRDERLRVRERLEHVADTYLSPNGLVQAALPALLAAHDEVAEQLRERITANRAALCASLRGSAASVYPSEGGAMAIVRLPALGSDEALCLRLLSQHGVLVQPGFFYELAQATCVVVSLLVHPATLLLGAAELRRFVDAGC